jgi:hypothetical protein
VYPIALRSLQKRPGSRAATPARVATGAVVRVGAAVEAVVVGEARDVAVAWVTMVVVGVAAVVDVVVVAVATIGDSWFGAGSMACAQLATVSAITVPITSHAVLMR